MKKITQFTIMTMLTQLCDPEKLLPVMYLVSGGHETVTSF